MDNIDFLKQILMTDHEYWIVAKKQSYRSMGESKRDKDQILFISIPSNIRRGLKHSEILLEDLLTLQNSEFVNIPLNTEFLPFQRGMTFHNVWMGFPLTLTGKIIEANKFLIEALSLDSSDIYKYGNMIKEKEEIKEPVTA